MTLVSQLVVFQLCVHSLSPYNLQAHLTVFRPSVRHTSGDILKLCGFNLTIHTFTLCSMVWSSCDYHQVRLYYYVSWYAVCSR